MSAQAYADEMARREDNRPTVKAYGVLRTALSEGHPEGVDVPSRLRHEQVVIRNSQQGFSGERVCHGGGYDPYFFSAFDVSGR